MPLQRELGHGCRPRLRNIPEHDTAVFGAGYHPRGVRRVVCTRQGDAKHVVLGGVKKRVSCIIDHRA